MAKKQFFNIKYPFRNEGIQHFYLDANETVMDKARSTLMHIVFTPKGQRIRLPEYGTDLIKHIFDQNDGVTWEAVKAEVAESVNRWAPYITIKDINVVKNENDDSQIFVRLDYNVKEGNKVTTDSIVVQV